MSIWRKFSTQALRHSRTNWNHNDDFFHFTRGRFVCDEAEQMAHRHVDFDMSELCRIAGDAAGKKQCIEVEKHADGMYNKAFLLTVDNNEQVVAKIPNPNAGLPDLTTASEVATMDFMRNTMKTPVPQVLAWASSDKNAVKSEYIIMEEARGVQLGSIWPKMEGHQKVQVVRAIARHLRTWSKISFTRIGSLYYSNDLPNTDSPGPIFFGDAGKLSLDSKFAIGPVLSREWTDFDRASIECDRGPWTSTLHYRRAVLKRDMQAARSLAKLPRPLSMLCGPSLYQPTREKKISACEAARKVLPHVIPRDQWASSFHIWHDDLHEENIFVDPEDPAKITDIIDWQSTSILPLFDHTMVPGLLDYDGPAVQGLDRPQIPSLSADLSPEEKASALELYDQQILASGFKQLLQGNIKPVFEAAMYEESESSGILSASRNLFEVGEAYCQGCIAELQDSPLQFSEAELARIQDDVKKTEASMNAMSVIKDALGPLFPEKGCVRPDQYEDAKAALMRIKQQVIEDFSKSAEDRHIWEEMWPFDD